METLTISLPEEKKTKSKKVTDRVKTFEDACAELGINTGDIVKLSVISELSGDAKSIGAYAQLIIITRALNEGWEPDWSNGDQPKYFPYFEANKAGSGFSYDDCDLWYAYSAVGSRLCFKTAELAKYAGEHFIEIYNEFLTLNSK